MPRAIEPNKIKRLTVRVKYSSVWGAWPNASDEAALLLQIFGNFVSVKDDTCVEISEGDNQHKVQNWINRYRPVAVAEASRRWRLEPLD